MFRSKSLPYLMQVYIFAKVETCHGIITSLHAFKRMLERGISDTDVEEVVLNGEVIKEYLDDKPYASKLFFKMIGKTPVHVVMAKNETGACIVITVYIPEVDIWEADFKTKK